MPFDPSTLANDSYILRLFATDLGGHEATIDHPITVAGDLKLGNFTLSFTDLSIPVSGIPITVTRTYDSLNAGVSDDLGYGWRWSWRMSTCGPALPKTTMEEYGDLQSLLHRNAGLCDASRRTAARLYLRAGTRREQPPGAAYWESTRRSLFPIRVSPVN